MSDDHRRTLKTLIGTLVHVACVDGHAVDGTLVNVNGTSLWLVAGETDHFIPLTEVVAWSPAA
jgi:hypothetical protein